MKEYIYDGTFEGLLTSLFYGFTEKEELTIYRRSQYTPNLLSNPKEIPTEFDKFQRVYDSIEQKLSSYTLKKVYYTYLCELPESETTLLRYLKLCYRYSDSVNLAKNNETIATIDLYQHKVTRESHRLKGFVRFKEIGPKTFYAKIEPDHNVLPLLVHHFTDRFSDQRMIIHDYTREYCMVYNLEEAHLEPLSQHDGDELVNHTDDSFYEKLFQDFYQAINIPERKNTRQRNLYMPKRYWKNLIELGEQ